MPQNHDFRLFIHQHEGNQYHLYLLDSPAGETPTSVPSTLPDDPTIQEILDYTRHLFAEPEEQKQLGQQLFNFLFPPDSPLRDLYQRSLGRLDREAGDILRLILQWDETQTALHQLPWEYLHDGERFLAQQRDHSLVRWLPVARPLAEAKTALPLRLLLVTAEPTNQKPLHLEQEISLMQSALADLIQAQQLELTILRNASPREFREKLQHVRPHLLHFAGHGYVRAETGETGLYFRGENGLAEPITAVKLAVLLHDIGLQMVVLGACHTAVPLGVAHALVKVGITAVLGMQYALSNEAGFTLARTFYRQLAQAATPETALNEARHALAFDFANQNHWAVPVLFLRTRDRGAPLVNLPYTPAERARYLAYLAAEHGTLTLPGGQKVPLEQLYVSLRADPLNAAEREAEHQYLLYQLDQNITQLQDDLSPNQRYQLHNAISLTPLARLMELRDAKQLFGQRQTEELSLAEVVNAHDQLIILGDPGSGKTTLGRWLVTQFAHVLQSGQTEVRVLADKVQAQHAPPDEAEDGDEDKAKVVNLGPVRWPIFVRIGEYAAGRFDPKLYDPDTGLTLGQFIERGQFHAAQTLQNKTELTPPQVGALADEAWRTGRALLVLDGLDEVGDPDQRRLVMEEVQRFTAESAAGNKLVLTSRLVGYLYAPLTHLAHYSVEAMGENAIRAFSQAWFTHVGLPEGQSVAEATTRFATALFEQAHPGVQAMAGNPLLLTILAQVFQNQPPTSDHPLPVRRADLFRQAEQAFYDQRLPQWRAVNLTLPSLRRALGRIAFYIHTHSVTGLVSHDQVWELLLNTLDDDERQAEAVLQAARQVSGFLVARGEGVYAFLHRGLQEYFVVCHLTDKPSRTAEAIAPYILDPTWQEPLALAVGLLQPGDNQSQALRRILETPDPVGEYLPHRELAAVAALQECLGLADEQIAEDTACRLIRLYGARMQKVNANNPLRQRLLAAWQALLASVGQKGVEQGWVASLGVRDFASRWGAVELLIEAEWFTLTTVRALLRAWRTHDEPTPTASILVALDMVAEKQPALLEQLAPTELPFRQRMVAEPEGWAKLGEAEAWRILMRLWYLPPAAMWEATAINRNSPLTPHVWAWLNDAPTDSEQLRPWLITQLQNVLPTSQGMAQRDLLAGLAGLGELTPQHHLQPRTLYVSWLQMVLSACACAFARGLTFERARDLTFALVEIHNITLAHARDLEYARARDITLAHACARDLEYTRALDLNRVLARAFTFADTRALDLTLALADDRNLDVRAQIDELDSLLTAGSERWQDDDEIMAELTRARQMLQGLRAGDWALWRPLLSVVTAVINQYEADEPAPTTALTEVPPLTLSHANLPQLIGQLTSRDDKERQAARELLQSGKEASTWEAGLLVALAEQALAHQGQYGVDTQIAWGLHRIEHDDPDQLAEWFRQATGAADCPYTYLLSHLHRQTEACLAQWHHLLPHTAPKVNEAVLESWRWQEKLPDTRQTWLQQWYETAPPELQPAILQPLMYAADNPEPLAAWFAAKSAATTNGAVRAELLKGLARQPARLKNAEDEASEARLRPWLVDPAGQVAWVRYWAGRLSHRTYLWQTADHTAMLYTAMLSTLQTSLPEATARLTAVIAAGTDDVPWKKNYHALLVQVGRDLILQEPDPLQQAALQQLVLRQYETTLQQGDWEERRFLLALLAALLEQMPQAIQNEAAHVCGEKLETLLVRGAQDAGSHNSRRFALSGLSYLRRVTPAILPVLTAGFLDVDVVQQDAIAAVSRFREVEGDLLSELIPYLTDDSALAAAGVGQLLGALGSSSTGERTAGLRDEIITALVSALADKQSEREVEVRGETKKLEDIFYESLLRVAGWGV